MNRNSGPGIAVLQSTQLTRLVTNCIVENGRGGLTVEKDCRVELRGNGIYENSGHGVRFNGSGQIMENDVVGNCGCGIQVSASTDIKVRWWIRLVSETCIILNILPLCILSELCDFCLQVVRNRVQPAQGCGIALLGPVKGVVHDNILFQGHPENKKPLLHADAGNETCVLRNNSILRSNSR